MKIYISIPISGLDISKQKEKASYISERIKALGHEPINPFDTPRTTCDMTEREEYAYYMGEGIKKILLCDAVFRCKGWDRSKGCQIEAHAAYYCGIAAYDHINDIPALNQMQ